MTKVYKYTPDNFNHIEEYLVGENFKEEIIKSNCCFFYDTCSLITHSNSYNSEKIAQYIKMEKGVIIITRTVLMELQNGSNLIEEQQVNYIKELYDAGIKIILLDEENILDILKVALDMTTIEFNKLLGAAINEVSRFKGTVYEIKKDDSNQITKKMMDNRCNKIEYYTDFFKFARGKKKSKDNLGEELMFVCFIVLSRINILGKLIYFSNDLKSRDIVISLNEFTESKHDKKEPYQITSVKLISILFDKGLIKTKDEMIEMLSCISSGNVKVFYVGKYDIDLVYKSFNKEQLVNKIFDEDEFKVIY